MTAPQPREFTLGQVLTVARADRAREQSFCAWGDLLEVVGFLLSDVPMLEELNDAIITKARPAVLEQHPGLAEVTPPPPSTSDTAVLAWLAQQEAELGPKLLLTPIEAAAP